jgi:AMP-binding enzyme
VAIVILGDPNAPPVVDDGRATLDDLFRERVGQAPDRIALADPPNRASVTDGAPRRMTYREADRVIGAMAGRLRQLGLPTDAVVGLQLPNTVEGVLAILGVLRAGMIAAPLPHLWRRAEAVAALGRLGAKALITIGRIGATDHGALAAEIAAELFSIRHVCSFGEAVADGVVPFDDLFDAEVPAPPSVERAGNPAAHVAVVTWDVTSRGMVAMARSHNALKAGALAVLAVAEVPQNAAILTACPPTSFAGLALGPLLWLLRGGTLSLHQPFDGETFAAQCRDEQSDTVVVPGTLLPRFAQAGLLGHDELRSVLALWRAPERLATSPFCRRDGVCVADVMTFGKTGLIATRRDAKGAPTPIPVGPAALPQVEPMLTEAGTLALRGAMVPRQPFPPGVASSDAPRPIGKANDGVDTGYSCRAEPDGAITVTGPPAGLVGVGGYPFVLRELQALTADVAPGASFAALPGALAGHRLAGQATDNAAARAAFAARGANALIAGAFREPGRAA